jgi:UDP-N-acetylmuramoyl-tripeptide--D-alanyl-D-alanine ligase
MTPAPVLWTFNETAKATRGRSQGTWRATGVSIDTRTLEPGDLFVALKGPTFDGHEFVGEALAKGAAAVMVSDVPTNVTTSAPMVVVDDTLRGLEALARMARARSRGQIIGVTGSVGKTSVKEALKSVLSAQEPTVANEGSLNNHWGLPLSLARMPDFASFGVFEMGMNHPGEIEPLSRLARPHVAVVTSVEAVHKAFFDSIEQIADAKAEIFAGVENDGIAVLNRDNPQFARLAKAAGARGIHRIIGFGLHPEAGVRLLSFDPGAGGSRVRASIAGETVKIELNVPGVHWVTNSLCVLAVVAAVGADVNAAVAALAKVVVPKGRGQRSRITVADGEFELIDDSYNASPVSMVASFDVLGRSEPGFGGRRIAVLGDMLELGDDAPKLHADLARPLLDRGINLVFTAGSAMAHLFDSLPAEVRGGHAVDSATLAPLVANAVRAGDVVSVKGSAGSRMGVIVDALRDLETNSDDRAAAPRVVNGD